MSVELFLLWSAILKKCWRYWTKSGLNQLSSTFVKIGSSEKKKSDWGKLVQIKFKPNLEDIYLYFTYKCAFGKVKILWEGHNILKNIPSCFKNTKSGQNKVGDFFKFCGLLRISEL